MKEATALEKIWPSDDAVSTRFPIFTRANTGEVFTVASSPFTWSLFGRVDYEGGFRDALYTMGVFTPDDFGPEGHGRCETVASFGGYVYINVSIFRILGLRAPGMSPEAIDQSFFGDNPNITPYTPHPDDENDERSAATGAWMAQVIGAPKGDTDNERHREEIDFLIAQRPDLPSLTHQELFERAQYLADRLRPVFATHMVNLYAATIVTGLITGAAALAGRPGLETRVISGFGDVHSAQQSFELWNLSRIVRNSPALTAAFDEGLSGLQDRLSSAEGPDAERFRSAWDTFLGNWGFIGPSVWELRSATYSSDPSIVLHMIDSARKASDDKSPTARTATFAAERTDAISEISALLEGTDMQPQFQAAAASAAITLPAREESKVQCTRIVNEARLTMIELGTRFVASGDLTRWDDILLLMDTEVEDFLSDPAAWKEVIDERRAQLTELEGLVPPFIVEDSYPDRSLFVPAGTSNGSGPAAAGEVLQGLGVSPGIHTGLVKVVHSIEEDIDIEPGDVLVAQTTDSSWGALFLSAGAVVGATGAAVSHAAIVSRELGIPAAVSVPNATTRLRSGMTVTVDGATGTVTVVDVPAV
ncbi:MAG TPA: PEP-utilizing enzyme [Microbacterium sp.]|nr:PEP-utilizing enzyme [Microbacterium sp.]